MPRSPLLEVTPPNDTGLPVSNFSAASFIYAAKYLDFPGCHRGQTICERTGSIPIFDRTPLYAKLMELEIQFVGPGRIRSLPKVDLTLAEMIVAGFPDL